MSDQTLFYWGMVVTLFLFFACVLTAHELFEQYMERREQAEEGEGDDGDFA